nr:immunoglobulin light chain junction region [Macaca mulatta]MOW04048.1 immunoglobulin light chain junction region [Macaca mulatta]MOW04053.1 immunoglobulin light chain junction region [Macaca mulatta]MOW04213.1 immunoglobulin light chain junction region [Macaca mulatta]MOW04234.1 immunoglobulin light chain junction region [Macaca mulatta]
DYYCGAWDSSLSAVLF